MTTTRLLCALTVAAALLLSGCDSLSMKNVQKVFTPAPKTEQSVARDDSQNDAPSRGAANLDVGVKKYEDGQYNEAAARLHAAIAEGLTPPEAVRAHKYLAFIHCASRHESECRKEFRKALAIDPRFQLNAAEAGHPMWGPVFREVKGRG